MSANILGKAIYLGPFAHCTTSRELSVCPAAAIGVDEHGKIAFLDQSVSSLAEYNPVVAGPQWRDASVIRAQGVGFFFPGLIDTHIHASQYPNLGLFGKSTLLDWLETYTFPTEARFADLSYARKVYTQCVNRLLANGTTTAAYYATIHEGATNLLADICHSAGQRAFIGRVCMDRLSPATYRDENSEVALAATERCMAHIDALDPSHELVDAILTPRFAPSCSEAALGALGALHRRTGKRIQTHISENVDEVRLVGEMFPNAESYAHVYDGAGLLTERTVLAHAVHLTADEKALVAARKAKIAHCPVSNTCLSSGVAPVRELLDRGIDVGLGTDVSGGYSTSILEAVRHAILVSRHAAMQNASDRAKLSTDEALYLATRGGAKVLGLQDKIGGFEVGMDWDAQMICLGEESLQDDSEVPSSVGQHVDLCGSETWTDKIEKWVYVGDDRNTLAVWVKGRLVHRTKDYIR